MTCDSAAGVQFGHAPSPRISRYLAIGVVGGGLAAALALASFVILLVTIIRHNRPGPRLA